MTNFKEMPYLKKNDDVSSKPLGILEINGEQKKYFITNGGVPDLYVQGISEPVIKVNIDFTPEQGWKVVDLVENPELQNILAQISEEKYKNYVEEVNSYVNYLNKNRPNG